MYIYCLKQQLTFLSSLCYADQCFQMQASIYECCLEQDLYLLFWVGSINASEWYWNTQQCLLKTIQELFMNSAWNGHCECWLCSRQHSGRLPSSNGRTLKVVLAASKLLPCWSKVFCFFFYFESSTLEPTVTVFSFKM